MEEDDKNMNSDNAQDKQRELEAALRAMRRAKVVEQAAEARLAGQRQLQWIKTGGTLLLLAALALFVYWFVDRSNVHTEGNTPSPQNMPQQQTPDTQQNDQNTNSPNESPTTAPRNPSTKNIPIAEAEIPKIAPPDFPAPQAMLRGQRATATQDRQALLNAIWYTDYPLLGLDVPVTGKWAGIDQRLRERNFTKAYIAIERLARTEPHNDTLACLKAYCLLQTGQGVEALQIWDNIQAMPPKWQAQIQWYRGLAYLQTGDSANALAIFDAIRQQNSHPYYRQAIKAATLMK